MDTVRAVAHDVARKGGIMVFPRLGILSTIDRELSQTARNVDGLFHSGEIVAYDPASGLARVLVRSGFQGETVELDGVGVLFDNAAAFVGFDSLILTPGGNLNGAAFALGPISRGDVLFSTAGSTVTAHSTARDVPGPLGDSPAWEIQLVGTETVLIHAISVALDSVSAARPFLRLDGGGVRSDWFAAGELPDAAQDTNAAPVFINFIGDTPYRVQAGSMLRLTAFAQRSEPLGVVIGSWRSFLTNDTPPAGQPLTTSNSPVPILRVHGSTA